MALVLVVDDSARARNALSSLLTRAGHAAIVALDGAEALRMIKANEPDVVLLDLVMPGIDGLAVLSRLAQEGAKASPPVVVVSAVSDEDTRKSAQELGAAGYFLKGSFEPPALLKRIDDLV